MSVAISGFVLMAAMLAHAGPAAAIGQSGPGAASQDKTACSLITRQEIEGITGRRISDVEPETVPTGTECRFRLSANEWVNVALGPIDAKTFATVRKLLGAQAENLAGVGDEAYFWGNVRVYVRVGTQSLVIGFARNDDGDAKTKAQLLALAKLGAPRLR
jgi:hypothetical protein